MTGAAMATTAVLAVLALAVVAVRLRLGRSRTRRDLEIRERIQLSRESGLAVIGARGELLLVGWGGGGVRLVSRLPPERVP